MFSARIQASTVSKMGLVITPPQSMITPRIGGWPGPGSSGVCGWLADVVSSGTESIVGDYVDPAATTPGQRDGRAGPAGIYGRPTSFGRGSGRGRRTESRTPSGTASPGPHGR